MVTKDGSRRYFAPISAAIGAICDGCNLEKRIITINIIIVIIIAATTTTIIIVISSSSSSITNNSVGAFVVVLWATSSDRRPQSSLP